MDTIGGDANQDLISNITANQTTALLQNVGGLFFGTKFAYISNELVYLNARLVMALSMFTPSTTGMEAYAHAIGQVSTNIANVNTVGYRTNQTMFYTLLGSAPAVKNNAAGISASRVDVQGVGYYDRTNIDDQGILNVTGNSFDVAISGNSNAFFTLKDDFNNTYYSRAGNFENRTENGVTYLISQNGLKVQGFTALDGGGFSAAAENIILKYPEKIPAQPTTEASITANVPANVDRNLFNIPVYSENHESDSLSMIFTKVEGKVNTWNLSFAVEGGTATGSETEVVFDSKGGLISPKNLNVDVQWDDGVSTNVALNISTMTQYDGGTGIATINQNGAPSGSFIKSYIDEGGIVKASYTNGNTYNIAKLAITGFTAPNNLLAVDGTLFEATNDVGESYFVSDNYLVPQALERSTVDIAEEFGTMIITQRAYTSNANAFTVNNEMLQTAVNLKT